MIDERIRAQMRGFVAGMPERYGRLETVIERGRRRRRLRQAVTGFGVVVAVGATIGLAGLFGLGAGLARDPAPVGAGRAVRVVEVAKGVELRVAPRVVESEGWRVYQALPGPPPRFDTDGLGQEIPLIPGDPWQFPRLGRSWGGGPGDSTSDLVYLGDLGEAKIALDLSPGHGTVCAFVEMGPFDGVTSVCSIGEGGEPFSVYAHAPPIGAAVGWTPLPEGTSVVVLRTADGASFWQRPVGRTVFFVRVDGACFGEATFTALDADGNVLDRGRVTPVGPCRVTP